MSYILVGYVSIVIFLLIVLSSFKTMAETGNTVMMDYSSNDSSLSWASIVIISIMHPIITLVLIGLTLYGITKENQEHSKNTSP